MLAQTSERVFYELQPAVPLSQLWHWLVGAAVVAFMVLFFVMMYCRDASGKESGLRFLLPVLRGVAVAGVLLFVLNPVLRSESRLVKPSRLIVLIDNSLSMGLKDSVDQGALRRIDLVTTALANSPGLETLNDQHGLEFYRFGDSAQAELIASLPKVGVPSGEPVEAIDASDSPKASLLARLQTSAQVGWFAIALFAASLLLAIGWLASFLRTSNGRARRAPEANELNSRSSRTSWLMAASVLLLVGGAIALAAADLHTPAFDLPVSLGWQHPDANQIPVESRTLGDPAERFEEEVESNEPGIRNAADIDWSTAVAPRGTSTRIGAVVEHIVNKERGGPIAGIVLITDGRSNAGIEPGRAIAAAGNAGIPVFTVGIGSTDAPMNVSIADMQAPSRVFPGDNFLIKGLIKAFGMEGSIVRVQLLSADETDPDAETIEDELPLRLSADGETVPVEFEVASLEQGKRIFKIRALPNEGDGDPDPRDNTRSATVEIVERKTVVLLMAGGPTREFRFLRNQLYRDKDVTLHVRLQTAGEGADQESDELLFEFPQTREEMFQYDCVIAFDPDWRELSVAQTVLLERWVAEKAGGLLAIAGPVFTPEWTRRPRGDEAIDNVRRLYPVSFFSQGSAALKLGRFGGENAFPLEFSREGRAAEYLWLGDSGNISAQTWSEFEGVFGYYAVNEAKPGADVLARFADPGTRINDRLPIYLASQYYGSGRVFFQASGEMWRIRRLDVEYFQQYYLKLLRWVSQGRLLRDSTRGVLLTDRDRCWMGDQVSVQAMLRNSRDEPLSVVELVATIHLPDGSTQNLKLQPLADAVRPGTYTGNFSAALEGEYTLHLPVPESPTGEVLRTKVEANIPDLEKEQPQRNDSLLQEMADKTQGHYYVGMSAWTVDSTDPTAPQNLIAPQDQESLLPGTPDRFFARKLMIWLLTVVVLSLALEWTLRRLHRLA